MPTKKSAETEEMLPDSFENDNRERSEMRMTAEKEVREGIQARMEHESIQDGLCSDDLVSVKSSA